METLVMTLEELEAEASKLPRGHLAELIDRLTMILDDLEAPGPEHDRLWREEVTRRYQNLKEGKSKLTPAEEVIAAIRAELR